MREIYFDNAATMTKYPEAIEVEADFYCKINANPLRGLYKKSVQATTEVEKARERVLKLVGADDSYTVIFTRGTTEALNLVARGLIRGGDGFGIVSKSAKVVVDIESHHSNLLPWTQRYKNVVIAKKMDARELFAADVISLTGISNVTGENFRERILEVRRTCPKAILGVDGAQMVGHTEINLTALGVDYMAFSGHKFGAPMGIGGLVIKKELARKLRPMDYGGEMVDSVSEIGEPTFSDIPERLEAGTLPVGAIFGLSEAAKIVEAHLMRWEDGCLPFESVAKKIDELREAAVNGLKKIKGVRILAANGAIITFKVKGVHPHDVAQLLADEGISVRAGWLCAEPYLRYKGWGPVVRLSFSEFNEVSEVTEFIKVMKNIRKKMGVKDV